MTRILKMLARIRANIPIVGFWHALLFDLTVIYNFRCHLLRLPPVRSLRWLTIDGIASPIALRVGTSDYLILRQIFTEQEYGPLLRLPEPRLILDCGANVGYSSIWFLNHYPNARIIAVEPDGDNHATCHLNLDPYQDRVVLLKSAVWSHPANLVCSAAGVTMECGSMVREAYDQESSDIIAVDVPSLIEMSGDGVVDLLKVDIEGAELEVFGAGAENWISKVKNIAIELHGEACRRTFSAAMASFDCESIQSGELTICRNIRRKDSCFGERLD